MTVINVPSAAALLVNSVSKLMETIATHVNAPIRYGCSMLIQIINRLSGVSHSGNELFFNDKFEEKGLLIYHKMFQT